MNDRKKRVPVQIQGVSGGQQLSFDISQVERKVCKACGWEMFDKVYRMGMISQFATGNTFKKDIPVEYALYVCRACGWEFNTEVKAKQ